MDNINKRCYRFKTIYNEKGLYDDFIDMSYVLLMENSKREKHVYEQINKFQPTKKVNIQYNRGYKKCRKKLCGEKANILKRMKKKTQINFMKKRPGDVGQVKANINKFKKTFKWKPKFNSINKILNSSIKWEKKLNHL